LPFLACLILEMVPPVPALAEERERRSHRQVGRPKTERLPGVPAFVRQHLACARKIRLPALRPPKEVPNAATCSLHGVLARGRLVSLFLYQFAREVPADRNHAVAPRDARPSPQRQPAGLVSPRRGIDGDHPPIAFAPALAMNAKRRR